MSRQVSLRSVLEAQYRLRAMDAWRAGASEKNVDCASRLAKELYSTGNSLFLFFITFS